MFNSDVSLSESIVCQYQYPILRCPEVDLALGGWAFDHRSLLQALVPNKKLQSGST